MFVLEHSEQILTINSAIANFQFHLSTYVSNGLFVIAEASPQKKRVEMRQANHGQVEPSRVKPAL